MAKARAETGGPQADEPKHGAARRKKVGKATIFLETTSQVKKLLARAAADDQRSLTQFVLRAAVRAAQELAPVKPTWDS